MPNTLLSDQQKRAMMLVGVIYGMALFDFMIASWLADVLSQLFFVPSTKTLRDIQNIGLIISTYLAIPIGAFLVGRHGDTFGRRSALWVSLMGIGVFSFIMGLLPTCLKIGVFAPVLFLSARFAQGMALGGLLPSTWVYLGELLPKRNTGLGMGLCVASGIFGLVILTLLIVALQNSFTQKQMLAYGWRIPFLIGGFVSLLLLFGFRHLPKLSKQELLDAERSILLSHVDDQESDDGLINKIGIRRVGVVPALMLAWVFVSVFMTINQLLASLINAGFDVARDLLTAGAMLAMIFMALGSLFFGFLIDRLSIGRVMVIGGVFMIVQLMLFFGHLQSGGDFILVFFVLLGFSAGVIVSTPVMLVSLFDVKNRLTHVATIFSLAYAVVGGLLPFGLGYATFHLKLAPALYLMMMAVMVVFLSFYSSYLPHQRHLHPPKHP